MEEKYLWHHCLFQVILSAQFWKAHGMKERCEEELEYAKLINARLPESMRYSGEDWESYEKLIVNVQWPSSEQTLANKITAKQVDQLSERSG